MDTQSPTAPRYFDLNIESFLEAWRVPHAIRELIANALDEQALTGTPDIRIVKERDGVWHIRDYGRGLNYEHLTQNENQEKLLHPERVVGRFGVGLKDALATLNRHGVEVRIHSGHAEICLAKAPKHGFDDVSTLHAALYPPASPTMVGTDVALSGAVDAAVEEAKGYFLRFTGDEILADTRYGQILRRQPGSPGRIYVKGLCVAEEDNFLFSYNVTALSPAMSRALNRERTAVGRSAYSARIKEMLMASDSEAVAQPLAADLSRLAQGTNHDEIAWLDVAAHASRILSARKPVVFVSPTQMLTARSAVDNAQQDGYQIVSLPEAVQSRLTGLADTAGQPVRSLEVYQADRLRSFQFLFIKEEDMTSLERGVFSARQRIAGLVGGLPPTVTEIRVSETMRPGLSDSDHSQGLWEPGAGQIIIRRSQLRSVKDFAGTLLHEMAHARSMQPDVSRGFEQELTAMLGEVAARSVAPNS